MKTSIAAFPDSVAFREILREKTRTKSVVKRNTATQELAVGKWQITSSDNGDLIAIHENGTTKVLASPDEGE